MTSQKKITSLTKRIEELKSLIDVSAIISSTLELDELIKLVMQKAQTVMNAEASSIMLLDEKTQRLHCQFALGEVQEQMKEKIQLELGQGIAGWVAQNGEPLIIADVNRDHRFYSNVDKITGFQTRSILAAPLTVKGNVIGVAEVLNRRDGESFTADNLELFTTFCHQVALAIENARYHKFMLEQQRMEQELESAHRIQQSFMPQSFPHSIDNTYQIFGKNVPATSVGGDFYDFIELDSQHLAFVIGDVSGKGIPAALYMARLVSDLRYYSQIKKDPVATVTSLNELLCERSQQGMFVTLQYLVLNCHTGKLSIVNAGHLPPYWKQQQRDHYEWIQDDVGVPLGILNNAEYEKIDLQLHSGDTIICYTDGITEARDINGTMFSSKRLAHVAAKTWNNAEKLGKGIISEVLKFSWNVPQKDDITVITLKWN